MELGLKGKTALVAASSKGLGKAVASELINEGARVVICARNGETLEKTRRELDKNNAEVYAFQIDLSDPEGLEKTLDAILNKVGSIDILVTNSGGPPPGKFEAFNHQNWQQAFELLVGSTTGLIRKVLPGMKRNRWGRIILITSQAVKQPVDNLVLSNAVRSSLSGLMKSLSNELGEFNITVNSVLPGYTKTERLTNLINSNPEFKKAEKEIPLGRFAEPKEFAAAVAFLASERASYITGISLAVDGGWIKGI